MDRFVRKGPKRTIGRGSRCSSPSKKSRQLKISEMSKVVVKKDVIDLREKLLGAYKQILKLNIRSSQQDRVKQSMIDEEELDFDWLSGKENEKDNGNKSSAACLSEKGLGFKADGDDDDPVRVSKLLSIEEDRIRATLKTIKTMYVSLETLKSSGIGKAVNSLTKCMPISSYVFPNDIVEEAKQLVQKWRKTAEDAMKRLHAASQKTNEVYQKKTITG